MSVSKEFREGEKLAFDVLRRFWADGYYDDKMISLPVDTADIAGKMNISVQAADFPSLDTVAVLVKDETMPFPRLIISKPNATAANARHICAVNIARVIQHEDEATFGFVDTVQGSVTDEFTKGFVEGLLMPQAAVLSLFASGKSIKKIARYFGVTETMLIRRLISVGIVDAMNRVDAA